MCARQGGISERKAMIYRNHRLALTKQAALLGSSRGSVYYEPVPVSDTDLALMRRLDELHLEFPFAGARMLRGLLAAEGSKTGRRHVTTLMRTMGIEAIYRRPNTSKPAPGHRVYPYLLRGLTIDRPNHVWATDITYIPMARGFVYLAAVMDEATCHGDVGDVGRPDMVWPIDRQSAQQIRIDAMTWRRLRCVGPAIDRFDPHPPHQCCDMTPADLAPLGSQQAEIGRAHVWTP